MCNNCIHHSIEAEKAFRASLGPDSNEVKEAIELQHQAVEMQAHAASYNTNKRKSSSAVAKR